MYVKLEDQAEVVENTGDILCRRYSHNIYPEGKNSIGNRGVRKTKGYEWEIFFIQHETPEGYYGMPMEGFGLAECYILKSDCRSFTPSELKKFNGASLRMYGSHTGADSGISWEIQIEPIQNKF